MMTPEQFGAYLKRLSLTEEGIAYLSIVRNGTNGQPAAPARAVESRVGNVIVRYASAKNEKALPLESRRVEFAIALLLENDDDVLEFWTQVPEIELRYLSGNNRKVRCGSKQDFLVLRTNGVEFVQAKPADKMPELVHEQPGRFQEVDNQHWRCAPGEEAARSFGFSFRVWTDAEFSRECIRNLKYLDPFLKLGPEYFPEARWKPVQEYLLAHPGISLDELGQRSGVEGQALVRWMLTRRLIYCDLDKFILAEPDKARVYPNASVAKAMEILRVPEPRWPSVGDKAASPSPPPVLQDLTKALLKHGKEAFAQAHRCWRVIQGLVPRHQWDVTRRSVTRWRSAFKKEGFLGLLHNRKKTQGNKKPKLELVVVSLADEMIERHLLKPPKTPINAVYLMLRDVCVEKKVKIPSRTWFYARIELLEKRKLVAAQEGSRAAYPYQFDLKSLEGLWDSRGDYPFMDVHCDHTQLSIFLRSERTGQVLGKPWLTILFDATCRAVLAIYLSFDRPSRDSLMMVLRDCVLRHGRMPLGMVVDNGSEFCSTYFETFTAANGVLVMRRPPHEPKFGNPVENCFGVTESQLIQVLEGSSLILKTPRKSTKSVDPRNRAIWTIAALHEALEFYCFEIFNKRDHADLGKSPAQAIAELMARHGIDQLPGVKFDNDFLIQTMPEVDDGTARVQKPCGVKVRGDYFHNPLLVGFIGKDLPARWDPMDPSRIFVQLPEGWVECVSKYKKEVEGLSARDVKFFAQELRQRHTATANSRAKSDTELGAFLRELRETKEPALRERVARAAESQAINTKLSGRKSSKTQQNGTPQVPQTLPVLPVAVDDGEIPQSLPPTRSKALNRV